MVAIIGAGRLCKKVKAYLHQYFPFSNISFAIVEKCRDEVKIRADRTDGQTLKGLFPLPVCRIYFPVPFSTEYSFSDTEYDCTALYRETRVGEKKISLNIRCYFRCYREFIGRDERARVCNHQRED